MLSGAHLPLGPAPRLISSLISDTVSPHGGASVGGCRWPCYCPQLCPLSSDPVGWCSLGRAWPSLGSPMLLWTCAACGHSWSSWLQSLRWDHFLDQPDFVPSSQRNAMSGWKGKGSLPPVLSPTPSCHMDKLQAAGGSLWEMGTLPGICRATMALGDNGIAYSHVVESRVQPQLGCMGQAPALVVPL